MPQLALRPYVTAGIAVAGAGIIAIAPIAPVSSASLPSPAAAAEFHAVQLTDAWSDLFTHTTANLKSISDNTDLTAITQVFSALFTNPLGVITAATDITPTVTTELAPLPATVAVQLPPALELLIANLGSQAIMLNAVHGVIGQLSDPATAGSALLNGPATILDAYLNGQENVSLLGGIINIPVLNGILAPEQNLEIDLNLTKLLDLLGLNNLDLSNLDLTNLLDQLGLGNITLGSLFSELGLATKGIGDLLGNPTLGGLLGDLGLGDLGLGSFSLTGILSGLGLDTNVDLNSLSLDSVLGVFGLNPDINLGLSTLLTDLGFGGLVSTSLGSLLGGLPGGVLAGITNSLNTVLGGLINGLGGLLGPLLGPVLGGVVLTPQNLIDALNAVTVGDLLGGQTLHDSVAGILQALGVTLPTGDLTIGGILEGLGFSASTGELTLSGLLGGLGGGLLDINIGSLLDGLNLGGLLSDLGLSDLNLDLSGIVGDLGNLNLGDLLGDLLPNMDLANISIGSFGGLVTELFETVPQQILDALGG
ncbi:hypothetical protein [[Mycobacterium] nativiensis]|uniref:PE-PGRS family protein n=1 Tax=[Mycobacterium] nativiensis TaxID=2855503 RepID=A0ABU5XUW7_9MYCO|nr:hypothetical protein [Mycolicibacter sp. MYC340]MEB3030530.1 hypothetical protein [Mycolicibacter sp. MYC340]